MSARKRPLASDRSLDSTNAAVNSGHPSIKNSKTAAGPSNDEQALKLNISYNGHGKDLEDRSPPRRQVVISRAKLEMCGRLVDILRNQLNSGLTELHYSINFEPKHVSNIIGMITEGLEITFRIPNKLLLKYLVILDSYHLEQHIPLSWAATCQYVLLGTYDSPTATWAALKLHHRFPTMEFDHPFFLAFHDMAVETYPSQANLWSGLKGLLDDLDVGHLNAFEVVLDQVIVHRRNILSQIFHAANARLRKHIRGPHNCGNASLQHDERKCKALRIGGLQVDLETNGIELADWKDLDTIDVFVSLNQLVANMKRTFDNRPTDPQVCVVKEEGLVQAMTDILRLDHNYQLEEIQFWLYHPNLVPVSIVSSTPDRGLSAVLAIYRRIYLALTSDDTSALDSAPQPVLSSTNSQTPDAIAVSQLNISIALLKSYLRQNIPDHGCTPEELATSIFAYLRDGPIPGAVEMLTNVVKSIASYDRANNRLTKKD
ncbi:hypothetical protein EJ08DRAFT_677344 [Tothia fuscella]|uniref:Uncharacterized protein n=1 Tax=Tothia fuscella TaxID=1048955 RepID=A0A9P4NW06_9PEZI|nr:hypothetical protein EJ08DRAFT_677344 [Tothia fuscella]